MAPTPLLVAAACLLCMSLPVWPAVAQSTTPAPGPDCATELGTFLGGNGTTCERCDGTSGFQDELGQAACKPVTATVACPPNQVVEPPTPSSDRACSDCPAGSTRTENAEGVEGCELCSQPGFYVPAGSSGECLNPFEGYPFRCPPNTTDNDSNTATPCVVCQPGTEVPNLESGSFSFGECKSCAPGRWDHDASAATACEPCAAGFFDNETLPATAPCQPCPPGTFALAGDVACAACPPGTWDHDGVGQTDCLVCPPGTFHDGVAPTQRCTPCPAGTFSATGMAASLAGCRPCDPGTWDHDGNGSTPCEPCAAGTFDDPARLPTESCLACPSGSFAGPSATACETCVAGTTDHDSDAATPCQACAPGQYAERARTGACQVCAPGTFSLEPTIPCAPCNGAGFASRPGMTACETCSPRLSNQYVVAECTTSSDRVLAVCADCGAAETVTACSVSADTVCGVNRDSSSDDSNAAVITGVIIGIALLFILICLVVACCWHRRRGERGNSYHVSQETLTVSRRGSAGKPSLYEPIDDAVIPHHIEGGLEGGHEITDYEEIGEPQSPALAAVSTAGSGDDEHATLEQLALYSSVDKKKKAAPKETEVVFFNGADPMYEDLDQVPMSPNGSIIAAVESTMQSFQDERLDSGAASPPIPPRIPTQARGSSHGPLDEAQVKAILLGADPPEDGVHMVYEPIGHTDRLVLAVLCDAVVHPFEFVFDGERYTNTMDNRKFATASALLEFYETNESFITNMPCRLRRRLLPSF